jgi:hypothetical protein
MTTSLLQLLDALAHTCAVILGEQCGQPVPDVLVFVIVLWFAVTITSAAAVKMLAR